MKSRPLFRALCVGAALLVPAGGLAVLGIGTAGASTVSLVATSQMKIGSLGTMTIAGIALFTSTSTGTIQRTETSQSLIIGSLIQNLKMLTILVMVKTTSGSKKIQDVAFRSGGSIGIVGTGATVKYNGCSITTLPAITYAKTTALKWTTTNVTLSGVKVTGSCTTKSVLTSDISGHKLSSTLTFSAA
jgi:hypothetical protein